MLYCIYTNERGEKKKKLCHFQPKWDRSHPTHKDNQKESRNHNAYLKKKEYSHKTVKSDKKHEESEKYEM